MCLLLLYLELLACLELCRILLDPFRCHICEIRSADASENHGYKMWWYSSVHGCMKHVPLNPALIQFQFFLFGFLFLLSSLLLLRLGH